MVREKITVCRVDGTWLRCGACGAKIGRIKEVYNPSLPKKCVIEHKCKAKYNGKTCNCLNDIVI